ncbi:MAG: hypothetical protein AAF702_30505 [Chloroflexota bacterium]
MDYRISVSENQLQKELEKAQDRYERRSDTWLVREPLGRVLRSMNDPAARIHLEKAASNYISSHIKEDRRRQSTDYIRAGNFYRLMDEHEIANQYFEDAYELAKHETGDLDDPEAVDYDHMQNLIEVCFLLGSYEEAVEYARLFHQDDPNTDLRAYRYGQLAEAKINQDLVLAEKLAVRTARGLKKGRTPTGTSGIAVTGWDFYEFILAVIDEIKENQSKVSITEADQSNTLSSTFDEDEVYLPAKIKENVKRKSRIYHDLDRLGRQRESLQRSLDNQPRNSMNQEKMGRILRLMGRAKAQDHLTQAAEINIAKAAELPQPTHSYMYLHIGQLYRLAGEADKARPHLQEAYKQLSRHVGHSLTGDINLEDPEALSYHLFGNFVVTCFLLGNDEEAFKYGRFLHENHDDSALIGYQIALLAQAKRENDSEKAELVAQINLYLLREDNEWTSAIEEAPESLGNSFTTMDMYELAVETVEGIEGE